MDKQKRSIKLGLIATAILALAVLTLSPQQTDTAAQSSRSFIVKASSIEDAREAVH